ncbi:MAG: hypothetical protein IPK66_18580 [Rhodospirillales bacterium]|nr:hypothetical protein [Rhodospirillales bacterium]
MKILSLGMGLQSTLIYLMSSLGELPRLDYAVFADPGSEMPETYAYLNWLISWQKSNNGVPIVVTGKKSLYNDLINGTNSTGGRFASIPCFTKSANGEIGILRRQCTKEYKIDEVNKSIRALYGLKKFARFPKTDLYMGITIDEITRMNYSKSNWATVFYPLCGYSATKNKLNKVYSFYSYNRGDCFRWYNKRHLPIPPKSACFFCPFQSDSRWQSMKVNQPEFFQLAVKLDYLIRDSRSKGCKEQLFLHRSCVPLDEVNFTGNKLDLFSNECSGNCGL